jgi:uroporphyrinogen decarboxylase
MTMTPRENFQRMMSGAGAERLPVDISATGPIIDLIESQRGTRDVEAAMGTDFRGVWAGPHTPAEQWLQAYRDLGVNLPAHVELTGVGFAHVAPPLETLGKAYHFRTMLHPLETVTDVRQLERLPWPRLEVPLAPLQARVAEVRREDRVAIGWQECTAFESAWYVRSMEALMMDLVEGHGIADWLLDWYTERSIVTCRAYAQAGIDVIGLGDDVGTQRGMMMSVDFWREHLKGRLAKVVRAIRAAQTGPLLIRYHSDGDIRPIIDDLIEIGVDILNPVQPECMPLEEVVHQYGQRLALWGMMGTQTTMPFGTPEDVRRQVKKVADAARGGARMVIAPTHVLEPDVPWENIVAFVDEAKHPFA